MNRCKTCKHWGAPHGAIRFPPKPMTEPIDPDTHEPMQMPYAAKQCGLPSQGRFEYPSEKDGFALSDASEYYAVLVTAEDFGCVRHLPIDEGNL